MSTFPRSRSRVRFGVVEIWYGSGCKSGSLFRSVSTGAMSETWAVKLGGLPHRDIRITFGRLSDICAFGSAGAQLRSSRRKFHAFSGGEDRTLLNEQLFHRDRNVAFKFFTVVVDGSVRIGTPRQQLMSSYRARPVQPRLGHSLGSFGLSPLSSDTAGQRRLCGRRGDNRFPSRHESQVERSHDPVHEVDRAIGSKRQKLCGTKWMKDQM
jgi:hypothetical protein